MEFRGLTADFMDPVMEIDPLIDPLDKPRDSSG
jgi:hypothetical protein